MRFVVKVFHNSDIFTKMINDIALAFKPQNKIFPMRCQSNKFKLLDYITKNVSKMTSEKSGFLKEVLVLA